MKKTFLSVIAALAFTGTFAQTKVNEGTITYSATYTLKPEQQQMAAMLPSEYTVDFKGDSAVAHMNTKMPVMNLITNSKTSYVRLLLDIPPMKKKLSVKFTPADLDMMSVEEPEYTATATAETKKIGAYTATKYKLKDAKASTESEAWFSKEVQLAGNAYTKLFDPSWGTPLEFDFKSNGIQMHLVVKEIKPGTVPAGSFTATSDYEEMTLEQLKSFGKR